MNHQGSRRPIFIFGCILFGIILATTVFTDHAVSVISEKQTVSGRACIIIDAGHGGEDGGAVSCTGVLESTINLQIALRLEDLMHLLGYDTRMIRTTDTDLHIEGTTISQRKNSDLRQRVQIISETENPILVSIHQNQFSDSRYSGAQVFYANSPGSKDLALIIQNGFLSTLNPGSNRKAKRCSGVYLMDKINCTGVLIECGFLSNVEEEAKLTDPKYQKKLCCVIASCLGVYLDQRAAD